MRGGEIGRRRDQVAVDSLSVFDLARLVMADCAFELSCGFVDQTLSFASGPIIFSPTPGGRGRSWLPTLTIGHCH